MVSACSWFDELNAGHWTRAIATSATAGTAVATTAAASMAAAGRPAVAEHGQIGSLRKIGRGTCRSTIIT